MNAVEYTLLHGLAVAGTGRRRSWAPTKPSPMARWRRASAGSRLHCAPWAWVRAIALPCRCSIHRIWSPCISPRWRPAVCPCQFPHAPAPRSWSGLWRSSSRP